MSCILIKLLDNFAWSIAPVSTRVASELSARLLVSLGSRPARRADSLNVKVRHKSRSEIASLPLLFVVKRTKERNARIIVRPLICSGRVPQ